MKFALGSLVSCRFFPKRYPKVVALMWKMITLDFGGLYLILQQAKCLKPSIVWLFLSTTLLSGGR